jgi:hypothetical protein
MRNIVNLKMNELLLETPVKPAEILNPFSPRFSSFLDPAFLGSFDRIFAEPFSN